MLDLAGQSSMSGWGRRKWSLLGFVPCGRQCRRGLASEDGVLMLFAGVVRSYIHCRPYPPKGGTDVGSESMNVVDG